MSLTKNAQVIALINQKGGVGKSTTTVNLASALGKKKKNVLIIDFDPQGNSTSGLGVERNEIKACIYDALLRDTPVSNIIKSTTSENVDIAPATTQLAAAEIELVSVMARETRLSMVLSGLVTSYDYILIDCPPSLGLLTINALTAADSVLIPIQCEYYALEGVSKLLESIKMVRARLNAHLDIFGVVMTMYDKRTTLSNQVVEEVKNYFGDKVFKSMIPRSVKLSEAPSHGLAIDNYAPHNKGAEAYKDLAKEVIKRG